jgi:hypothetical protein
VRFLGKTPRLELGGGYGLSDLTRGLERHFNEFEIGEVAAAVVHTVRGP